MSTFYARRDEDVKKLKELERQTGGKIRVLQVSGNPIARIDIRLMVRTAGDHNYPTKALAEVNAMIELGARYPFEAPSVTITTKVFNPNVYTSGRVCLGTKWVATEFLDLLAQRLFKILAFDEEIINTESAANGDAARWYIRARSKFPKEFPSATLAAVASTPSSSITWTDKSKSQAVATDNRVIVACPKCQTKLRLPAGRNGNVSCPKCEHTFMANT